MHYGAQNVKHWFSKTTSVLMPAFFLCDFYEVPMLVKSCSLSLGTLTVIYPTMTTAWTGYELKGMGYSVVRRSMKINGLN